MRELTIICCMLCLSGCGLVNRVIPRRPSARIILSHYQDVDSNHAIMTKNIDETDSKNTKTALGDNQEKLCVF